MTNPPTDTLLEDLEELAQDQGVTAGRLLDDAMKEIRRLRERNSRLEAALHKYNSFYYGLHNLLEESGLAD